MKKHTGKRWSISEASGEFGIHRDALSKRLRVAGILAGVDGAFSTKQITNAIYGDFDAQHLKRETALARIAELKQGELEHSLLPAVLVVRVWSQTITAF